ncbi:hypothetical protein [Microbacterium dauci]|uniref:Uncharacterized protein n=1 Tax=Microbacterium dauci TaxID=3048008 RepID=A0ABT6ZDT2_9MICO|nr:hypothetical protein [Microbacterium sp. LX3-4]MDJ1113792.1 hypothetical protein [Microbacterium sp. LX3-4]
MKLNHFGAPKPENFDELTRTWNDPQAFARELGRYYEQLRADDSPTIDITEPRREPLSPQERGDR